MTQSTQSVTNLTQHTSAQSMMKALDGLGNVRGMLAFVAGIVLAGLMVTIGGTIAARIVATWPVMLFGLIGLICLMVGFSAAGFLAMDKIRILPQRSLAEAMLSAIFSLPRFLGVFLLTLVAVIAAIIVASILLFVCMIPGLGTALYTLVFPVCILLLGVVLVIFYFVAISVIAPAIWEGSTVLDVMAKAWALSKYRSIHLIINFLLLSLIASVVWGIIALILLTGTSLTTMLSSAILHSGSHFSMMSLLSMYGNMGGVSGYFQAAIIGGGLLSGIVFSLPSMVMIHGICISYLQAKEGVDFSGEQAKIEAGLNKAKEKANEAKQRAEQLNQRESTTTSIAAEPPPTVIEPAAGQQHCPQCKAALNVDDIFCGECGYKL